MFEFQNLFADIPFFIKSNDLIGILILTFTTCSASYKSCGVVERRNGTGLTFSAARPANFEAAYCACNKCGCGLFGLFYSCLSLLSPSLGDGPTLTEIQFQRT